MVYLPIFPINLSQMRVTTTVTTPYMDPMGIAAVEKIGGVVEVPWARSLTMDEVALSDAQIACPPTHPLAVVGGPDPKTNGMGGGEGSH